jgi:hypothetical protein
MATTPPTRGALMCGVLARSQRFHFEYFTGDFMIQTVTMMMIKVRMKSLIYDEDDRLLMSSARMNDF